MTLIAVAMRAELGQVAQDSIQLFDYDSITSRRWKCREEAW